MDETRIRESRAANLKDVLDFTPGILIRPRFGSDESQISIRGSGLRNNFHLRGINVLIDGFPYGNADGFSDFEALELLTTKRIEVYRGASALRFGGNTLGGAINLVTKTGYDAGLFEIRTEAGSFGFLKNYIGTGQVYGPWDFYIGLTDTELENFRQHAEQIRRRAYGTVGYAAARRHHLALRSRLHRQPRTPAGIAHQGGDGQQPPAGRPHLPGHGGRAQLQVHAGRLHRAYPDRRQPDARVVDAAQLPGSRPSAAVRRHRRHDVQLVERAPLDAGGAAVRPRQSRAGWDCSMRARARTTTSSRTSTAPADRRPRTRSTAASNYAIYAENQFDVTPTFTAVAGLRGQYAVRSVHDQLGTDSTDSVDFQSLSPKLGFLWTVAPGAQVYGNASHAYEPPLILELTAPGQIGGDLSQLKAQQAWQFEIGTRGSWSDRVTWDIAVYDIELWDEIQNVNVQPFPGAPFTIPRYQNIRRSRHTGAEAGLDVLLLRDLLAPRRPGHDRRRAAHRASPTPGRTSSS